jgi:hypothetical protein
MITSWIGQNITVPICDVHMDKGSFWNVLSVVLSRNVVAIYTLGSKGVPY